MELSVVFQCPSCNRKFPHSLAHLRPGHPRDCEACGDTVTLTVESLDDLRKALCEACCH